VASVTAAQRDLNQNRPWRETATILGRGMYQGAVPTSLAALGQTAQHTNSISPADATLSNTAASYTALGGRYQIAGRVGAATDFALFAYQVPAGWRAVITGVYISSVNLGAAVAGFPTVLDWSLGVGASAVSLATADGFLPNSYAPRRIPLGIQSFKVGDAAGVMAPDLVRTFLTPVVCEALTHSVGSYIHVILQVPSGAATASQKIRGDVTIIGHWD
jgi:hypothetical protein